MHWNWPAQTGFCAQGDLRSIECFFEEVESFSPQCLLPINMHAWDDMLVPCLVSLAHRPRWPRQDPFTGFQELATASTIRRTPVRWVDVGCQNFPNLANGSDRKLRKRSPPPTPLCTSTLVHGSMLKRWWKRKK